MVQMLIFLVLMFGMFYFLMIRPQRKRQADHLSLIQSLQKGDKVLTLSGLYGEIDQIDDASIVLKVEDGGKIKVLKNSIMSLQ